jgi:hypothetical protein
VELSGARSFRRQTKALYPDHRHFSEPHWPNRATAPAIVRGRPNQPTVSARNRLRKPEQSVLNTAAGATNAVPTDSATDNLTNRPRVLLQLQTKGLCLGSQYLSLSLHSRISLRTLTVKLRGRVEAPAWSCGCTLSPRTRGDTTAPHGPLQRLLDATALVTCPI